MWSESENIVDAKLYPDRLLGLGGKGLSIALGAMLIGITLMLDWNAGRSSGLGSCLTSPFIVCTLITACLGYQVIPVLRDLKAGQFIREDGPKAHLKKAGTPTMGGIFIVPVGLAIALFATGFNGNVVAACALTLSYAAIGFLDDWQILRRRSNKGISPRTKLFLQIGFASLFCLWIYWTQPSSVTHVLLPFGLTLPLGILFFPIAGFALVAESNATNLTDGIDGLAGGTGAIALLGLGAVMAPTSPGLMVFCACMAGCYLGFLAHNRNPARVFMGDTGSLALGGALASVALMTQSMLVLLILSGIFLMETLSVIAQVSYYKATKDENGIGKRLFKMAPLHHHLELVGWSELQIVGWFYLVGLVLVFLCLVIF